MSDEHRERLRNIRRFDQLVAYLYDDLKWPIETDDFEDLTFDYEAEDLGLDFKTAAVYAEFGFSPSKRFDLRGAQAGLQKLTSFSKPIRQMLHRPFDRRFVFFHPSVVWSLSRPMADHMARGDNLALVATRQVTRPQFEHAFVSRDIVEIKVCSHDRNTQIFPLFIRELDGELALTSGATANLNQTLLAKLARDFRVNLKNGTRELGEGNELTPRRVFDYAYAILYCPTYRIRYFEFLRSDFPRLPLTENLDLFRALARLGGELVALHLLESPKLNKPLTIYTGPPNPEVRRVGWANKAVWLDAPPTPRGATAAPHPGTIGFRGVPEAVWNFHIGGYQVCGKWLKDRKGRTLSKEDIAHYHRIVVALAETIRLIKEVDEIINQHGGWPDAFSTEPVQREETETPDPST